MDAPTLRASAAGTIIRHAGSPQKHKARICIRALHESEK
jgi:hypothetical protein